MEESQVTEKQYDDDIKVGANGKHYSKDSLVQGIKRFSAFKEGAAGGDFGDFEGAPLDPGLFKKNPSGFNIKAACDWLHQKSAASSQHICATFVRMAMEKGGINTGGRPNWAWKYINYLPSVGFKFIGKASRNSGYTPEPGDIAVYQKGGNPNVPGHICMWTGNEWASDFKQKNMIVYQSTPEAYIFRFT